MCSSDLINNFIVGQKLDLSKPIHVEHARKLIYDRYLIVSGSKKELNGILTTILNNFEKTQAELQFQKNLPNASMRRESSPTMAI